MTEVFISMKPMSKRLVVRITDSQAKWLAIALSQENTTRALGLETILFLSKSLLDADILTILLFPEATSVPRIYTDAQSRF